MIYELLGFQNFSKQILVANQKYAIICICTYSFL